MLGFQSYPGEYANVKQQQGMPNKTTTTREDQGDYIDIVFWSGKPVDSLLSQLLSWQVKGTQVGRC